MAFSHTWSLNIQHKTHCSFPQLVKNWIQETGVMLSSTLMPFLNTQLLGLFTCGNSWKNSGQGLGWLLLEAVIRTANDNGQRKRSMWCWKQIPIPAAWGCLLLGGQKEEGYAYPSFPCSAWAAGVLGRLLGGWFAGKTNALHQHCNTQESTGDWSVTAVDSGWQTQSVHSMAAWKGWSLHDRGCAPASSGKGRITQPGKHSEKSFRHLKQWLLFLISAFQIFLGLLLFLSFNK